MASLGTPGCLSPPPPLHRPRHRAAWRGHFWHWDRGGDGLPGLDGSKGGEVRARVLAPDRCQGRLSPMRTSAPRGPKELVCFPIGRMTDQLLFGGLRTISVSFQSKTAIQTSLPVSSLKAAWEMWPRGVALLLTPAPSPAAPESPNPAAEQDSVVVFLPHPLPLR